MPFTEGKSKGYSQNDQQSIREQLYCPQTIEIILGCTIYHSEGKNVEGSLKGFVLGYQLRIRLIVIVRADIINIVIKYGHICVAVAYAFDI